MRTPRGVAVALIVLATAAGCTGDGDKAGDKTGDTAPSMPERAPTWETSVTGIDVPAQASVIGDTVIVQSDKLVLALSRTNGSERWRQPIEIDTEVRVTPRSVVLYDDQHITVYDVRTGRRGFTYTSPARGRTAVSAGAVFVHTCPTGTTACSVVAYGLPGGAVLWRHGHTRNISFDPRIELPGDYSNRLSEPGRYREPLVARPAEVVLISREGGDRLTPVSVLDAATGRVLGSREAATTRTRIVDGKTTITWNDDSEVCDVRLTGYAVRTGKQLWTRSAGRWGDAGVGEPDCDSIVWTPAVNGTTAAITTPDRRPELIELDTGKVRWTGDAGTQVMDLNAATVLARADRGNGPLVGLDTADGHRRWQIDLSNEFGTEQVDRSAIIGSRLAFSLSDLQAGNGIRQVVQVHNAGTGELEWAAKGTNWTLGVGQDWLVTASEGTNNHEGPIAIRLFAG